MLLLYALFNDLRRYYRFSGSRKLSSRIVLTALFHKFSGVHSLDNLKNQSASVSFCRSSRACSGQSGAVTQWPERGCDTVARYRLVRHVSSSLIGGGRLSNTLLSVMLSIAVLTNEVCIAWSYSFLVLASNDNTVWLCLVKSVSFIFLGG